MLLIFITCSISFSLSTIDSPLRFFIRFFSSFLQAYIFPVARVWQAHTSPKPPLPRTRYIRKVLEVTACRSSHFHWIHQKYRHQHTLYFTLLSAWKAKKCFCLLGIRRLALFVCWEYDVWHFWTFYFNLYANTNQLHAWKHCSCIFDTFLAFSRTRIFKNLLSFQVFPTILAILTIFKTL